MCKIFIAQNNLQQFLIWNGCVPVHGRWALYGIGICHSSVALQQFTLWRICLGWSCCGGKLKCHFSCLHQLINPFAIIDFVWTLKIANQDVCRPTTSVQIMSYLSELWSHDFWGQDIKLPDSHKSFRPITVLSYRLNFLVNGLDAFGYHLLNAIIFALSAVLLYIFAVQFLNRGGK